MNQPQINITPASPHNNGQAFRRQGSQSFPAGASYPSAPYPASQPYGQSYAPASQPPIVDDGSFVSKVRKASSKAEDIMELWSQPLKPYLPGLGRFLIVVTFLEDALRIGTQYGDQIYYLSVSLQCPPMHPLG